ncbi:PH, RCC1 and FYVE domains-containing protein 1-like isoform X1 [Gastrolobium bilobum]|uniref:PH, RCC1 and FYVE domains-containing protein 1-like isoform X1 n=1 Tax=Gastrolobium bilobum TaxID=150636 RepID=UPI002AB01626|nr:PH, RCC1 and FYVE domains-containing protein 1-like isoform X1 [Gastrolobium bilobum]
MADPASNGSLERDIEQALIALKKGTQLIKYSRKAKPKVCPFRLSLDETTLIWISRKKERNLKLSSVSRIIPGQRTAVFRRYLQPEKDYLSFSLLYNNGERTLDLICKDKAEAEVWFAGLKTLISTGKLNNRRTRSELPDFQDGADFIPNGRPFGAALEFTSSIARGRFSTDSASRESANPHVGLERANMQPRTSVGDGFRVSVSSTPSCSSGGSGTDDIESLGDVYIWGEVFADSGSTDGFGTQVSSTTDVLIPKPLESSIVLDVQQIASGVRHIALVTRQGEVFTWGEESGGRLGHGIDKDVGHPQIVEFLAVTNVDFVACGENHTCAVSTSDDLFSWGDGTYNVGLLGHGTEVSHWIPRRISGPLEGLQVISVACGTWHSALATSNGKLFTFGDGTFGVLGHGNRESVSYPKEVQLLSGLKTIKVACGVWHTAAIVEVMFQSGSHVSSRKLFTWGDGDKYRLGHGNKETYLQPTCVSALIEYNFHQIACGHTMTVALTTSGHLFTMGGTENGQLGNPSSDGKIPGLVQDKLVGEFVEEISCGAHHVAVLTSRSELYTWGKGANGRLGQGDIEDRKFPTVVEALKDRHVKNISCGSNFTSCICIHKWVSGVDQSACTGCRQPFGFTRKRHNCYNCGLVHCHACSSKKALKAALAPTPGKPHRVCDSCYAKLKAVEAGITPNLNRKVTTPPRGSLDGRERFGLGEIRSSRILLPPTIEPIKYLEIRANKPGNFYSSGFAPSQVPTHLQLKDIAFSSSASSIQYALKPAIPPSPPPTPPLNSRPASPYVRRPSPPRSGTPGFSRSLIDSLRKTNEILNQEVSKLQNQFRSLKQKSDMEIKKLQKNVQEATSLAGEESSKHRAVKEFIESTVDQLKEMTEKLPPEDLESENLRTMLTRAEDFLKENSESETSSVPSNLESEQQNEPNTPASNSDSSKLQEHRIEEDNEAEGDNQSQDGGNVLQESNSSSLSSTEATVPPQSSENHPKSLDSSRSGREGETQVIEQFEPGVYVTLIVKHGGIKVFKRVRFSKRRFHEHQAEEWWNKNKERVLRKYSLPATTSQEGTESSSTPPPAEQNIEAAPSET